MWSVGFLSSSKVPSLSDETLHSSSIFVLVFSVEKSISNEPILSARVQLSNDVHTLGTRRVLDSAALQISAGVLAL